MRCGLLIFLLAINALGQGFTLRDSAFIAASVSGMPNVTDGLIAWWKFDDATGEVVTESISGNHAYRSNTAYGSGNWTTGIAGGALNFDGVTNLAYVASNPVALSLTNVSAFTITFWHKRETNGMAYILSKRQNVEVLSQASANGTYFFDQYVTNAARARVSQTTSVLPTNAWIFLTLIQTNLATTNFLNVLTNSVALTGTTDTKVGTTFSGAYGMCFGQRAYNSFGSAPQTATTIDDVRIYNRALTPTEITTIYNWRP